VTVLALERYPVDPSNVAAFEASMDERLGRMRAAAGNLWADLARAGDDAPSFLVLSEWRTAADADAWDAAGSPEDLDPLLRGDVTRRRFVSEH
jgi:quinol monooxygenase YgiN